MPRLLRLDSSADLVESTSRLVTDAFAQAWLARGTAHTVVSRDLHQDPLPHLPDSELHFAARLQRADAAPAPAASALQGTLIDELAASDVVVIGAPMYNWSIPSTLKAWLDYVHVLGTTVPFDGPDQPMLNKPVVVVSTRGGEYGPGTPNEGWDHSVPPIELVLGRSMGMKVSVIPVELTLASRIEQMEPLRDRSKANLDAALARARDLAATLGD